MFVQAEPTGPLAKSIQLLHVPEYQPAVASDKGGMMQVRGTIVLCIFRLYIINIDSYRSPPHPICCPSY